MRVKYNKTPKQRIINVLCCNRERENIVEDVSVIDHMACSYVLILDLSCKIKAMLNMQSLLVVRNCNIGVKQKFEVYGL